MAQCVTQATLTTNSVHVDQSTSTSFSASQITASPTTSTITDVTTSCTTPAPASSGAAAAPTCQTITTTSVTVIAGGVTTTQVPIVVTNAVTSTEQITLFTTSCQGSTSNPSPSESAQPVTSTPPPTVITSSSASTDANGSITNVPVTIVSTLPATTISPSSSSNGQGTVQDNQGKKSSSQIGAIAGGVVGGIIGLAAILTLVWFYIKRRRNWDDIFDGQYNEHMKNQQTPGSKPRLDLDSEYEDGPATIEPKPYQYGLVGGPIPSPVGHGQNSPPDTPPSTFSDRFVGVADATTTNTNNNIARPPSSASSRPQHERVTSLSPLYQSDSGQHHHQQSASGISLTSPPVQHASSDYFNLGPMFEANRPGSRQSNNNSLSSPPLAPQRSRSPVGSSPFSPPASASALPPGAAPPVNMSQNNVSYPAGSSGGDRTSYSAAPQSASTAARTPNPNHRTSSSTTGSIEMSLPMHRGVLGVVNGAPMSPMSPAPDARYTTSPPPMDGNGNGSGRRQSSLVPDRPESAAMNVRSTDEKGRVTLSSGARSGGGVKVHTDGGRAPPGYSE